MSRARDLANLASIAADVPTDAEVTAQINEAVATTTPTALMTMGA